jgi:Zn-dependent M28 family amino/carboxypeptidase
MTATAIKANYSGLTLWLKISLSVLCCASPMAMSQPLYDDLQALTSVSHAGREAGSEIPNKSAQYLFERFRQLGLESEFQSFNFKSGFFTQSKGHNVIARLPCNMMSCGKTMVITAHYDHLGSNGRKIYAGANDNASGTAALVAIATRLKNIRRQHDVVFVATDAEEKGLLGAKHYTSLISDSTQYALNINLDMLAINSKNTLYVMHSKTAEPYTQQLGKLDSKSFKLKLVGSPRRMQRLLKDDRIDWLKASDHYAFYRAGIPYLYFGMGEDKNHHSVKDTLEAMDFYKYQQVVMFISDFMVSLLERPSKLTS